MSIDAAVATPERMHLVNLVTGEDLEVFFNPEQLEEEVIANYVEPTVVGLSHTPSQYVNTSNHNISMDLYSVGNTEQERVLMEDFRRFLLSLCYPDGNAGSIARGAPARVLFVWPKVYTLEVLVKSVKIRMTQFAIDGRISRYTASIVISEIRDVRITSDEVRRHGTRRSANGQGFSSSS